MLVLKRKIGESIMLGDDIQIQIVDVDGDFVKLGIEAPRSVRIWRKELYDSIMQENRSAMSLEQNQLEKMLKQFKR